MGVLNAMSAAGLAMATRDGLLALYETAVAAAHPSACLPAHLPAVPALTLQGKATGRALAIISGEELAVGLRNLEGRGGRCQYALALALDGTPGISALAADTGGKPTDAAGATIEPATLGGVRHLDAKNFRHNNEATSFFEAAGGLIVRGPTHTNVNDFRVILVDA